MHIRTGLQFSVRHFGGQPRTDPSDFGLLEPQRGVLNPALSGVTSRLTWGTVKVRWREVDTDERASPRDCGDF